jgi:hypothetical protein
VVLQSACNVHVLPFFVNVHAVSIGGSNALTDRAAIFGVFVPNGFVVVSGVVVRVGAVVVVVVVGLADVVEVDVDAPGDRDEFAGSIVTAVLDARSASAGTRLVYMSSSRIGVAARTVTMRRLIEPRFGHARQL